MTQGSILSRIILICIILLLLLLACLWPWLSPVDLVILPTPDKVVVFVNDEEVRDITEPVPVQKGKIVRLRVQIYYRGRPMENPGEFTYQWCFAPPIEGADLCSVENSRAESYSDYKPLNTDLQKLEITIKHDVLKTSSVSLSLKPE